MSATTPEPRCVICGATLGPEGPPITIHAGFYDFFAPYQLEDVVALQAAGREVGRVCERRLAPRGGCRLALVSSRPPSIRACGSPAHGSPTFFTADIRLPGATAGWAGAQR